MRLITSKTLRLRLIYLPAVTDYLRNSANVPMRRILTPAGYGATHAAAPNSDSQGRDINQRVDVKVLVNKGLTEGI